MKELVDPKGNYLKSEKNVVNYLKTISDKQLKSLHYNIELTPFPILLGKEYHRRFFPNKLKQFKMKNSQKSRLLGKIKKNKNNLKSISLNLGKKYPKKGTTSKKIVKNSQLVGKKISEKGSKQIKTGINAAKRATKSTDNIILLKELGKLKKEGLLSEKEFTRKKKEILSRV